MKSLFLSGILWPGISACSLCILFLLTACNGAADDKLKDTKQTSSETPYNNTPNPQDQALEGQDPEENATDPHKQPGSGANTPVTGTEQPEDGARKGGTNQNGKGKGSGAQTTSPQFTLLDWQGGVTIYGKKPQKGQRFDKDAVGFSKTSDFLMVKNKDGATFFILPKGYKDDETKDEACTQQQCIPTLMAVAAIGSAKRLSKWYKSKTETPPSPGGGIKKEKTINSASPAGAGKNPPLKPAPGIKPMPQSQKLKEIQKTKQFQQKQ